ncbi:MAG: GDP-mannose 4,6-dehydratase [Candidatus Schekmanbacteria bacterium]|nr:GDP-mannose 4,6-dehydratase [Candidatus Schekmanbacteria bacterium]
MNNYWQNRNVFVTGCTGLLGSWLTDELIRQGANVTGLIRDWLPQSNLIRLGAYDKIKVVRGQIEDYDLLERTLNEYEIDTVFHLAAQTIVTIANRNPLSTFSANIEGTWKLLEACRRNPLVRCIVMASSDKAYGDSKQLPYTETTPLEGRHPYDASKSCADLIAQSYYQTYKLPVCVTRCGNFYGGGDLNFNRIVPGTIRSILFNERPIIRSDGSYIRDYFFIRDGVKAYLFLAQKMVEKSLYGESFNFSNEIQMSVLDLTNKILQLMGREDLSPIVKNEVRGEIYHQYLSAAKARKVLGWAPDYTLDRGLRETIDWYREFFQGGRQ